MLEWKTQKKYFFKNFFNKFMKLVVLIVFEAGVY